MTNKKLSDVRGDPDEPEILQRYCQNLSMLFLNDNLFTRLSEGSFYGLKKVQSISLYQNFITKIDFLGAETCPFLEKLYLENNRISRLEGLTHCNRLKELYIGHQNIGNRLFELDEYSLAAISGSLELLDMPEVNLVESKSLYYLENVTTLNLKGNLINDFHEQVGPFLMTTQRLDSLFLAGNPVIQNTDKYRD